MFLCKQCLPVCFATQTLDVRVPESPAVALFGSDAVLNCSFSGVSEFNLSDLSVFWQLSDTKRAVHSFWQSRDQLSDQEERFSNRTSLFQDQLVSGNASLLLRRVRVADEGSYSCFVRVQTYGSAAMLMQVAAPFSKLLVTWGPESALKPGDAVALSCVAYGGYPEAEVLWQDGAGHNLTHNVTVSQVANEEGLFSSVLTVILEPSSTYSCRLSQPLLGEEAQASVTISGITPTLFDMKMHLFTAAAVCSTTVVINIDLAEFACFSTANKRKTRIRFETKHADQKHFGRQMHFCNYLLQNLKSF
uniref:CD276 molecule n=1 Tax=Sinocyclocheilus anshuiensis TaxID=1608454 RepID=A0A671K3K3_9TELE